MNETFYLVWSPSGSSPPRCRHEAFDRAKRQAELLAENAPGSEFFVLTAVSRSHKVVVSTEMLRTDLDLDRELPF